MTGHDAPLESALDDDILVYLSDELTPEPMDAAMAARVKRQLLRRVAEDQRDCHVTIAKTEGQWQPFGPGLTYKLLYEADGVMSYLLRLAPGARLAPHRHPIDEECVVLEGTLQIGEVSLGSGGFHLALKDTLHGDITSVDGALIYLHGATPHPRHLV